MHDQQNATKGGVKVRVNVSYFMDDPEHRNLGLPIRPSLQALRKSSKAAALTCEPKLAYRQTE